MFSNWISLLWARLSLLFSASPLGRSTQHTPHTRLSRRRTSRNMWVSPKQTIFWPLSATLMFEDVNVHCEMYTTAKWIIFRSNKNLTWFCQRTQIHYLESFQCFRSLSLEDWLPNDQDLKDKVISMTGQLMWDTPIKSRQGGCYGTRLTQKNSITPAYLCQS